MGDGFFLPVATVLSGLRGACARRASSSVSPAGYTVASGGLAPRHSSASVST